MVFPGRATKEYVLLLALSEKLAFGLLPLCMVDAAWEA